MNRFEWTLEILLGSSWLLYLAIAIVYAAKMWSARRTKSARSAERAPFVSILKPLSGVDDDLWSNLESFTRIDYPEFEIAFGVSSPRDDAALIARKLIAAYPSLRMRLVITDPQASYNPKVAQLIGLFAQSSGDVVVISDSNVRVSSDYLWSTVEELQAEHVGLVTHVFTGAGERSLGAALENLQLGVAIAPAVVASSLLGYPITVGKSMAMKRRDMIRVDALPRVRNVLAEDYVLGQIFREANMRVRTSLRVIENRNTECSIARTIERHSRWAKMRRSIAPLGFLLEPLASPLVVATAVFFLTPTRHFAADLLLTACLQTVTSNAMAAIGRGATFGWSTLPLEVVRAYVSLYCWGTAWLSRDICWRGNRFRIGANSVITPYGGPSKNRLGSAFRG